MDKNKNNSERLEHCGHDVFGAVVAGVVGVFLLPVMLKQKTKQFHSKSKRLTKLEGVTENQRLDIVKLKQEMFDVVKSIPQKIVLKMGI